MSDRPVTLAVVTGAHGVAGEVRLKTFTEDMGRNKAVFANGRPMTIKSVRHGSNGAIARIEGVNDRNAAEALRGVELTVPRAALPVLQPGEYYHSDLMGLPAVSTEGEALGRVVMVENFGAGDVIEIERPDGKRFMVPMSAQAVPEWDLERLVVNATFAG